MASRRLVAPTSAARFPRATETFSLLKRALNKPRRCERSLRQRERTALRKDGSRPLTVSSIELWSPLKVRDLCVPEEHINAKAASRRCLLVRFVLREGRAIAPAGNNRC